MDTSALPSSNGKSSDSEEFDSWTFIEDQKPVQPQINEGNKSPSFLISDNEPNLLEQLLEDIALESDVSGVEEVKDLSSNPEANEELSDGISIISECDDLDVPNQTVKDPFEPPQAICDEPSDAELARLEYLNELNPPSDDDALEDFKITTSTLVVCGILGGIFAIAVVNFLGLFNSPTADSLDSSTISPLIMRIHELEMQNEELRKEIKKSLNTRTFHTEQPPPIGNTNERFMEEERLASKLEQPELNDLYYQRLREGKLSKKVWTGDDGGAETVVDSKFQLPEYCRRNIAEDDLFSKYNLKNCEKKMRKIEQRLERDKLKRQKVVDRLKDSRSNDFFNPQELRELMKENSNIEDSGKNMLLVETIEEPTGDVEYLNPNSDPNWIDHTIFAENDNQNELDILAELQKTDVTVDLDMEAEGKFEDDDFHEIQDINVGTPKDIEKRWKKEAKSKKDHDKKKHEYSVGVSEENGQFQKTHKSRDQKVDDSRFKKSTKFEMHESKHTDKYPSSKNFKKDNKTYRIKAENPEEQQFNKDIKRQSKDLRNFTEDELKVKSHKKDKYNELKFSSSSEESKEMKFKSKEKSTKNAKDKRKDYKTKSKEVWNEFKENEERRRDKRDTTSDEVDMKYLKRAQPVNDSKYSPVEEKHRRYDSREQFHNLNKRSTHPDWHEKLMHNREELRKFGEYKKHLRQSNWYLQRGNDREKSRKETPAAPQN